MFRAAIDFAMPSRMLIDDGTDGLTYKAIGIAMGIHKHYGPGLLEKAYLRPFVEELKAAGHAVQCQPGLPIEHGDVRIENAFRPDMIVDGKLVIEVKALAVLLEVHKQQLSTYMRLAGIRAGLLINFNVPVLRHGIRRVLLPQ
jgi:GxxExxY protein